MSGIRTKKREESRDTVLSHEAPHTAVRLVRVGTGGVDRQTGAPLRTYWETEVKLRGHAGVTRTFSHERNARIAYLMAQYGVTDFTTLVADLGGRLWEEPRNMTALSKLEPVMTALSKLEPVAPCSGPRMNGGDSEPDSQEAGQACPSSHPEPQEAAQVAS
jgi:hypothetical protein